MYRVRRPPQLPKVSQVNPISVQHQRLALPKEGACTSAAVPGAMATSRTIKKSHLRSFKLSQSFNSADGSSPELRSPIFKFRNSEPEIFTFESVPKPQQRSSAIRVRKPRRVLYPAKVKKYLPPAETSPAKRWLVFFFSIILLQVYMEEGVHDVGMEDHERQSILNRQPESALLLISAQASGEGLASVHKVSENVTSSTRLNANGKDAFNDSKAETPISQMQAQTSPYRVLHQEHHRASPCENGFCSYIMVSLPVIEHRF